jgi:hypothetical protein
MKAGQFEMNRRLGYIGVDFLFECSQFTSTAFLDPDWPAKPSSSHPREARFLIPVNETLLSGALWRRSSESQKFRKILAATPYKRFVMSRIDDATAFVPRGQVCGIEPSGRHEAPACLSREEMVDVNAMQTLVSKRPPSTSGNAIYVGSDLRFVLYEGSLHKNPNLQTLISPDDHHDNVFPSHGFQLSNSHNFLWSYSDCGINNPNPFVKCDQRYERLKRNAPGKNGLDK